ncbi:MULTISPECIES: hypothetical protein [unclassified Beijerinckia]|uniref:hypothetical protein n=1 Tax=unclassified Beijerinckia TaxID=2638183 RepID=UPI00089B7066|nr:MULTISPECIES: hypothetical protein [unclassified Beijerinckia]MDH7799942.1 hypothetical protein [Beijerinckia sp. GAS462]SED43379.1 hypothetical protein SAMN05443249_5360 [Beijerinckia sp. 28-YEA-48]
MRRAFAFRFTSLRLGLVILAVHAMLGMGFVDAVVRSAAASSLPAGVGVLCLSDWSGNPGDPPPHRAGHDGSSLCPVSCFHFVASTPHAPAYQPPQRSASFDEQTGVHASLLFPAPGGREGAPVRGPPMIDPIA